MTWIEALVVFAVGFMAGEMAFWRRSNAAKLKGALQLKGIKAQTREGRQLLAMWVDQLAGIDKPVSHYEGIE